MRSPVVVLEMDLRDCEGSNVGKGGVEHRFPVLALPIRGWRHSPT